MALAVTNSASLADATDLASYNFAVAAPAGTSWLIVDVFNRFLTPPEVNVPTLSGGGLTYQLELTQNGPQPINRRLSRYTAQIAGASPGAFTLTVDFAGQVQTSSCVEVNEVTGYAGDPIVQTTFGFGGSFVLPFLPRYEVRGKLEEFSSNLNRPLMTNQNANTAAYTPKEGYTLLGAGQAGADARCQSIWHATEPDPFPSAFLGSDQNVIWIASELRAEDTPVRRREGMLS